MDIADFNELQSLAEDLDILSRKIEFIVSDDENYPELTEISIAITVASEKLTDYIDYVGRNPYDIWKGER